MFLTRIITFSVLGLCHFLHESEAQEATNLLRRYFKEYFNEYVPTPYRSYTLYGNGQNGPADFNGGLPYDIKKSGKVNSLIFSTSANPPLTPPKATRQIGQPGRSKLATGIVENSWVYPNAVPNAFYPSSAPQAVAQQSQPSTIQQQSRSDVLRTEPLLLETPSPEPMAESRMVKEELLQSDADVVLPNGNFNGDDMHAISISTSMAF